MKKETEVEMKLQEAIDQWRKPHRHEDVLDPCPFCGSSQDNAGEYPFPSGREWIARCGNIEHCGAEIRLGSREDVIAAWNRRAG